MLFVTFLILYQDKIVRVDNIDELLAFPVAGVNYRLSKKEYSMNFSGNSK